MTGRNAEDEGMVCGGTVEVFVESICWQEQSWIHTYLIKSLDMW
jgi:xanthine/CO dehydrogenase XdhC/CoxF family maturation factor